MEYAEEDEEGRRGGGKSVKRSLMQDGEQWGIMQENSNIWLVN